MTTYKLDELAREADVSPRTVRYYVQRGLLPPPDFRGSQSSYGPAHLLRLRVVKKLQAERSPLEEIASRLAGATLDQLERMLREPARSTGSSRPPPPLPEGGRGSGPYRGAPAGALRDHVSPRFDSPAHAETWERATLLPGVELHVRADASAAARRVAREILKLYGPYSSNDVEE